ncbi:dihydrodipicolinate synthase family protein [Citrobacter portucalensis]|uniref:dihydrodipicolinate synthase family protein n=1 Tax=Citrobacter portucalensis TaxID=1639133 RepID=UPI0022432E6A|nr:dihydrodipicolinate synthase family protein [Citrobacter portucalensis]MCW8353813.1 dihydrodipicolinate synthase family protein [Citrobacter portucalensis]MCX8995106.1 dihydrodipicolinate synthase family protein [Citrobacter portucalensis]MCX9042886.1 dihydrodipicolinate synthase family protein [Citrobacter portucalensis]MCX9053621.1 dihydrodipicolinate synthase family protein [Citrobacter portucalensis]MCX9058396.1 dihydrodipicolinate synthase family protein [Citrobacter portucalensis]
MNKPRFHGVIPPVPTLFNAEGEFDRKAQAILIEHLIDSPVDGLFFLGSAGEFAHMSEAQRQEVTRFCLHTVAGRKPVLIGIAFCGTRQTIDAGLFAQQEGASGVVVVNPWYNPLSEANLVHHYTLIANALELPIILYNFPALTGQPLPVNVIRDLAIACPNIVGLKDTVDTLSHIRETIHAVKSVRPDFAVFAGYDEYLLGTLILGGDGCIPASANFAPQLTCGILDAWHKGEFNRAVSLQQSLSWIPPLYAMDLPFYNAIKYALQLTDLDIPVHALPPASPLTEDMKVEIKNILQRAGVIA